MANYDVITNNKHYIDIAKAINDKMGTPEASYKPSEMAAAIAAERRQFEYNNRKCIEFEGELYTVTKAGELFAYYLAEGKAEKTEAITALIVEAKEKIRNEFQLQGE